MEALGDRERRSHTKSKGIRISESESGIFRSDYDHSKRRIGDKMDQKGNERYIKGIQIEKESLWTMDEA